MPAPDDQSQDPALQATAAVSDPGTLATESPGVGSAMRELPQVAGDRYALQGEVGRGGLGRVLRARDEVLDRPVAIKELFVADDASQRRFVREALITARLQHPSIVPVYDAGRREDRSAFYAMKLVEGRPLDRALGDCKTLADRLALLPSVLAVADAVAYAHSERIIHRDLKPANVLVGQFGETIVIDWGLAKDLSIDDREALPAGPYRGEVDRTVAGALLGTPGYMAPEQAAGEEADERADVYALGAMLYHLVSGIAPHEGTTIEEVIARLLVGDIRPLVEREPQTPRELAAIVGKAMAAKREDRYRTARELADDLRRFLTGQLVGAHHYTFGQRVVRVIKRHRAPSAVIAVSIVVLAVFLVRLVAEQQRAQRGEQTAIERANDAMLSQARASSERDPAATLLWLGKMSPAGQGWEEARVLAAEALAHPRATGLWRGTDESVQVTRDGKRAVGFDHNGIYIADLDVREPMRVVAERTDRNESHRLELCDDGRRAFAVVGGFVEQKVFEIDLDARKATRQRAPFKWVEAVERCKAERAARGGEGMDAAWLTPDRKHVVAFALAGGLRRFDLAGKEIASVAGPPITNVGRDIQTGWPHIEIAMSRDGGLVVTKEQGKGTLWSFKTGRAQTIRKGEELRGIAVLPDGSAALASTRDLVVKIANDHELVEEVDWGMPRGALTLSEDGSWLGILDEKDQLSIMDMHGGAARLVLGHSRVKSFAFVENRLLTTGDRMLRSWDLGTPAQSHGRGSAREVAFSPAGTWVMIDNGKSLARRDGTGAFEVAEHAETMHSIAIAIADSGDAVLSLAGAISKWPRAGKPVELGKHEAAQAATVAIARDGTVFTASESSFAIWGPTGPRYIPLPRVRAARGRAPAPFVVDDMAKRALVACQPDGERRRTCLVDLATNAVHPLAESRGEMAMSRDGRIAITGTDGEAYLLWDLDRRTSTKHADVGSPTALGISDDGTHAVVGGLAGIDLVELPAGTRKPIPAQDIQGTVKFSPNGLSFIDANLTVWDVTSGRSRKVHANGKHYDLRDDKLVVVGWQTIATIPDDLPRGPADLQALLAKLPYALDEHQRLRIGP